MTRRYLLVINPGSGTIDEELEAHLRTALGDATTFRLGEGDLAQAVGEGISQERVIVAAGGDGTINSVAQHLAGSGVMGVVPGGTMNNFARDLGVEDVDAALTALKEGVEQRVDVGRANGRLFVNNTGLGLYPELVQERERSEDRIGKWPAALVAAIRLWRTSRPLLGTISADSDRRILRAWAVFVGNNVYSTTPGSIGKRDRLDEGVLDVRVITAQVRFNRLRPTWLTFRQRSWGPRGQVRVSASRCEVRLDGGGRPVSYDGEAADPRSSLEAESLPGALTVLAPGRG